MTLSAEHQAKRAQDYRPGFRSASPEHKVSPCAAKMQHLVVGETDLCRRVSAEGRCSWRAALPCPPSRGGGPHTAARRCPRESPWSRGGVSEMPFRQTPPGWTLSCLVPRGGGEDNSGGGSAPGVSAGQVQAGSQRM